jgi:hypothetical protein
MSIIKLRGHEAAWVRPIRLVAVVCLTLLISVSGCSSTPKSTRSGSPSAGDVLAKAPSWVTRGCRAYWPRVETRRQVVCGIGSAPADRNRVAARETAIARARAALARSLHVTIESLVRLSDQGDDEGELATIVHQLSSTSLRGVRVESEWRSETGEIHALVSLGLDQVRHTVRNTRTLSPSEREDLAERAADAFAQMDAAFENPTNPTSEGDARVGAP